MKIRDFMKMNDILDFMKYCSDNYYDDPFGIMEFRQDRLDRYKEFITEYLNKKSENNEN